MSSILPTTAVPVWLFTQNADGTLSPASAGGGSGVSSINTLTGAVTLAAGSNITITPSGNTLTIASTGGGAVSSVFGRTGAVVAAANDYNFNQLAGTVALATQASGQLPIGNVGSAGLTGTSPITIDSTGAIGIGFPDRSVSGTTDTILSSDRGARVVYTNVGAVAVTLPQAGSAGFTNSFYYDTANEGVGGVVTITPTTSTINGNATLVLLTGQSCRIGPSSTGTSYAADCTESQQTAGSNITLTRAIHGLTVGVVANPTFSGAGAASTASVSLTGTIFTGGSATTTFPNFYQNYGAAPTTWSASGTIHGINAPNGFTGNFADYHTNGGASVWTVSASGAMATGGSATFGGNVQAAASNIFLWTGRSRMASAADGRINIANNAGTGAITRLTFGPETTSFPAFTTSSTAISVTLGDGTAGGTLTAGNIAAIQSCGTTSSCSATAIATTARIVYGSAPLVSGTPSTVTISGISPAFSSSSSYVCNATDVTAATSNLLSVANVSGSSFTITGPATNTNTINYICVGN